MTTKFSSVLFAFPWLEESGCNILTRYFTEEIRV